ncbi:hypothetical protein DICPUDRAFT_98084 [Dictyostelium purpureum]|uniref:Uncharacterized protein n=1 Tax=Dictyostelium purpureum TaxID=5786 RepID=F0ZMK7_DICPU|nr:uncharacterized protein DICPUDRAFT_98084 [Dictyostelium purpureum]EGC34844.1 hypothetical protein DICPUDRAFT_98084 [Dictyostelium purpureum]|eukprot:XP_003288651.1 hypothetical protein DICPUDRAFT_98084 [Dictyostelium purpureum]
MEDNKEEVALQILFNFKNSCEQTSSIFASTSAQTTPILGGRTFRSLSCSSPSIGIHDPTFDFVPSSPNRSYLPSLNNSTSGVPNNNNCNTNRHNNNTNSNNNNNDNESPLPPIPTIFSGLSKNSLIPSSPLSFSIGESINSANSTNNNTTNATSLLGSSSETAFQSLSSSPSHSVPSSPPTFNKNKVQNQYQLSPSSSYTNLLSSSPSVSLQNAFVQNCNISSPNLNNSLSPISLSIGSNNNSALFQNVHCVLNDCLLCSRGQPEVLIKSPTWASIMRVVFFTLHNEMKEKEFFSLKSDVYDFMTGHWDVLCLNKKKSDNWHKQIQDMLSHSKNIFESGMDKYKQNGFWRLKQNTDPWILPQKGTRKNSTSASSSPSLNLTPMSPSASSNSLIPALTSPLMLSSPTKQRLFSEEFNINGRKRSLSALEFPHSQLASSPNLESVQMDLEVRKKRNSSSEYSSVNNSPKLNLVVLGSSTGKLTPSSPILSNSSSKVRSHSVTTTITPLSRSVTSFKAISDEDDDELYIDDE